jgi:hypothetical protein
MAIASGIAKQVRYKAESAYNTAPGASGAQSLRRVESSINVDKDTYASAELRTDYQISDFRHGTRRTSGSIKGELSPLTYADFMAAALRKDFVAGVSAASLSLTIAGAGPYTVTRATGSWLTDGFKAGDVVRITAGSVNASNLNKNLYVVSLTATILTVVVPNASAMVAEGPIASCTCSVTGKKTYTPTTGHTDKSFAIEHWFSDIAQSELYLGCKASALDIQLPPTGLATIGVDVMGSGSVTTGTSAYYTSPTAPTTTGIAAAVNGLLYIGATAVATCTGLSLRVDGGYSGDPVVGSNFMPGIFPGRVNVTGQFTAYFENATFRDAFLNETELALSALLTSDNAAAANFLAFNLPRIKLGSASRSDGEKGLILTANFQALYNGSGGTGISSEATTLSVQDSAA